MPKRSNDFQRLIILLQTQLTDATVTESKFLADNQNGEDVLRREARKVAATNDQLRKLADEVRAIAGPTSLEPTPKQEGTKALEIRQIELYEDATYLNKHFTPIDLGDIFEVATFQAVHPAGPTLRHDGPV